jgi:hypothetical protein
MVHYGDSSDNCDSGTEPFEIYDAGSFFEEQCGGGTWTLDGDAIQLYMPDCSLEWNGTWDGGDNIIDGEFSTDGDDGGDGDDGAQDDSSTNCWFAERIDETTTFSNDITYTGEPIEYPVEMTVIPDILLAHLYMLYHY